MSFLKKRFTFLFWLIVILAFIGRNTMAVTLPLVDPKLAGVVGLLHFQHAASGQEQEDSSCCSTAEELNNDIIRHTKLPVSVSFAISPKPFFQILLQPVLSFISCDKTVLLFILYQLLRL